MKTTLILLLVLTTFGFAAAQDYSQVYRSGEVKLTADANYGSGNNWETLFGDYDAVQYNNPVGSYRSLGIAGDGTVFVCNYSSYSIYKFDPGGKFVKEWGEEGWGDGQFTYRPKMAGVLDDKYVITYEHNGRINLFDLDGNFVKRVQIDYMPLKGVTLKDNRIAVIGHVAWRGRQTRYIVSIINVETGDEMIVSDSFLKHEDISRIQVKKGEMLISCSNPTSKINRFLSSTADGNLVVGQSDETEVILFSPYGDRLGDIDLSITPLPVTQEIRDEYIEGVEESVRDDVLPSEVLSQVRAAEFFPEFMPYYYNLLVDPENNILAFVYTEHEGAPRFQVYTFDQNGKFVGEASLVGDAWDCALSHRFNTLQFHGKDIYAIITLSTSTGTPMRLAKLTMSN